MRFGTSPESNLIVLHVTRRFWPHSAGRHERAASSVRLVQLWAKSGIHVEVLTPRYANTWSKQFLLGDVMVHRAASRPRGEWSIARYVRFLSQWIADWIHKSHERCGSLELVVVVDGVNHDCRAVRAALASSSVQGLANLRLRTLVLCDGWGADADEVIAENSRHGKKNLAAALSFDGVVTRHGAADRFWVSQGLAAEKLHRLPVGFARPEKPDQATKIAAQQSLAAANTDLALANNEKVLLWCGAMQGVENSESHVGRLINNARLLCARFPTLKIWLIGDGELHDWAHTELKAEGVRTVVSIPGSFPDMTDVFRAVDFAVVTDEAQLRYGLPRVLEAAYPLMLRDCRLIRDWLRERLDSSVVDSMAWYDHSRDASFRKVFRGLWEDESAAREHALEIAAELSRRHTVQAELQAWLRAMELPTSGASQVDA